MRGDPRDEICRKTSELSADALIMGSRGLGTIRRVFVGSVSDHCVHHVDCPVIIIKDKHPQAASVKQTGPEMPPAAVLH
ncbi:hypothetical protein BDK51DRAFT_49979 [Blyttiomyces helicus]|uniref:UspA domain-containing protein n=1 Tax=Blyttiomyces helicus TaxID=388810 RepID=A0A4P9VYL7_9FUNG|nr:hypothetical protein BDK51DRAFT_49979 [Blyttiomyces helicus]|eukprot:RKO83420.1 hypothetical protein BDK51DRAFT_49979 [Blyttiomyces helicus]